MRTTEAIAELDCAIEKASLGRTFRNLNPMRRAQVTGQRRAQQSGYDHPAYRGLTRPYAPGSHRLQWFSSTPRAANTYVEGAHEGANILPAKVRLGRTAIVHARGGSTWRQIPLKAIKGPARGHVQRAMGRSATHASTEQIASILHASKKFDSVRFRGVRDTMKGDADSGTVTAIFNTRNIRSRFQKARLITKAAFRAADFAKPGTRAYHIPLGRALSARMEVKPGEGGHLVQWAIKGSRRNLGATDKQRVGMHAMRGVVEALTHDANTHKPSAYRFVGASASRTKLYDHLARRLASASGYSAERSGAAMTLRRIAKMLKSLGR